MPWFTDWFDSPYYHTLYHYRDEHEAEVFLSNLLNTLHISFEKEILDLACGKGRHSVYLHKLGYRVCGVDLSESSIQYAKQFEGPNLQFKVHDMRDVLPQAQFGAVLNLFTSFGYYKDDTDHLKTLRSIHTMLAQDGLFVLDFFNLPYVLRSLIPFEQKIIDEVVFQIHREADAMYVYKRIEVQDKGRKTQYQERVRAFSKTDLEQLLSKSGFNVNQVFGSYLLTPFDNQLSERCILVAQKA